MNGIVYLVLLSLVSADSVNCFKNILENFCKNQDIVYDYQTVIDVTGNRSEAVF